MEGLFLVLIAGALFAHAWYLLGLYNDGRTTGIIIAALGAGALIAFTLDPTLLGDSESSTARVAQLTVMKTLILAWVVYTAVVAAHGLWDFDDRAIGFYGVPLTAVSVLALAYFGTQMTGDYDWPVWLSFAAVSALLSFIAALLFFYMAIPFRVLKSFCAWSMLVLSVVIAAVGMGILTAGIS